MAAPALLDGSHFSWQAISILVSSSGVGTGEEKQECPYQDAIRKRVQALVNSERCSEVIQGMDATAAALILKSVDCSSSFIAIVNAAVLRCVFSCRACLASVALPL